MTDAMARHTPVLLIYFNRPKVLERMLHALAEVQPSQLFVASDGPRADRPEDAELVERCHRLVRDLVTWNCEIQTLRAATNHGCDNWVPKAVSWFFDEVEQGIILEDDCIITGSFYRFASEMLDRFQQEPEIMSISAANFHQRQWGDGDYFMSRYALCWGWATWRRAWQTFDPSLQELDGLLNGGLESIVSTAEERRFWARFFRGLRSGRFTYWDAKWIYSIWQANGVTIAPNCNLVSNIGYGSDATHTSKKEKVMEATIAKLSFPLRPPADEIVCAQADRDLFRSRFRPTLSGRLTAVLKRLGDRAGRAR